MEDERKCCIQSDREPSEIHCWLVAYDMHDSGGDKDAKVTRWQVKEGGKLHLGVVGECTAAWAVEDCSVLERVNGQQ